MGAPVTMSTSAWTEIAAAGFKKAIVKAGNKGGAWLELATSTPSSGSTALGIYLNPREERVIETGDSTLGLYGRTADSGTVTVNVLELGAPGVVATEFSGAQVAEVTFTEAGGAGTYTGSVTIPAGSTVHDVIVSGVALWDNAGAVSMDVGDAADPNGFFAAINLKATDLLAGESVSFESAGGKAGAYIANSQVSPRYSASQRVISGVITTASTGGSAGRTRMTVVYSKPAAALVSAGTFVAA